MQVSISRDSGQGLKFDSEKFSFGIDESNILSSKGDVEPSLPTPDAIPTMGEPESTLQTIVVKKNQGVLKALASAGINERYAAYGQLARTDQLSFDPKTFSPIVMLGQELYYDPNLAQIGDDELGRQLVSNEGKKRGEILAVAKEKTLRLEAEYLKKQVEMDQLYKQVYMSKPYKLVRMPEPLPNAPIKSEFVTNYENFVGAWDDGIEKNRVDLKAMQDNAGSASAAVGYAVLGKVRDGGTSFIRAGLGLGGVGVDFLDSAVNGNLGRDTLRYVNSVANALPSWNELKGFDVLRVSFSLKINSGNDVKVMLGTDRVGIQFKQKDRVDLVERYTWDYSDKPLKQEIMLEKNITEIQILKARAGKYIIPLSVVPGVRQNLSTTRAITPSLNFDANTSSIVNGTKFSIELRKKGG